MKTKRCKCYIVFMVSSKLELFKKPFIHIILITILGILAYSNTFDVPFVFDDILNIVENYKIKDISNFWPPSGSRWFGFLTFALNYHLEGLNTFGYHIFNLLIHILNAILIYWLVVLTLRTPYFKVHSSSFIVHSKRLISHEQSTMSYEPSILIALFSALIFVSHPIQTQAVTYIVQRFASLATMFYLLSLVMYIKFRIQQSAISSQQSAPHPSLPLEGGGQGRGWRLHATRYTLYAVSLISAVLAMKTKEISFTLPVIITLYEFMFFNGEIKKRLLYLIPILLTMLIIPLSLVGMDKPVGDTIAAIEESIKATNEISRWDYLFTQFRVITTYIRLLFLPVNQTSDYDYPIYHSFFDPEVFLSFLFLLSIIGIGVYFFYRSRFTVHDSLTCHPEPEAKGLRDSSAAPQNDTESITRYTLHATPSHFEQVQGIRLTAFGIFWFFITLSVESSVIPISDIIFEHRVYLPSAGVFMAITTAVFVVSNKIKNRLQQFKKAIIPAFALIIVVLTVATYLRNTVWHEEITLWEDVINKSPGNVRGYNMIGIIYKNNGEIDKAISAYQKAIQLKPNYAEAHVNLGSAYVKKGMLDEALKEFLIALSSQSLDDIDTAALCVNIGTLFLNQGLSDKAIEYYNYALKITPEDATIHFSLGIAYRFKGWNDKAAEHFNKALILNPDKY